MSVMLFNESKSLQMKWWWKVVCEEGGGADHCRRNLELAECYLQRSAALAREQVRSLPPAASKKGGSSVFWELTELVPKAVHHLGP